MLFHSKEFVLFFPIVFGLYLLLEHRWQNRLLLVASYIFYGAWDWRFTLLLLITTLIDFYCGISIVDSPTKPRKKFYLLLSLYANLMVLGFFKYFDFFSANLHKLLIVLFGSAGDPVLLHILLPVGISFYTFQTMSYSIDVYRGKIQPARNLIDFALYISFFPQLVAGPIERATNLLPQILNTRTVTLEKFLSGAYLFFWGIFLKVFIADNLANIVDQVYRAQADYHGGMVLIATYAFSIQIYGDFAGYSIMAIGVARALGVELMENFRRPYFSKNSADFWRRWHISLSSWFRDYMFSPFYQYVSGWSWIKRHSIRWQHGIAFFITLLTTQSVLGLWHGASWNFVIFGIYHALAIWLYYYTRRWWDAMPSLLQIILMFHVTAIGWLLFRAPTLDQAWAMLQAIFLHFGWNAQLTQMTLQLIGYSFILFAVHGFEEFHNDNEIVLKWPKWVRYPFYVVLLCLVLIHGSFTDRPFIYFQF